MSLARGQTDAAPTSIMEPMDTFEFIRSVPTQLFVGGRFVPAENNATFPVADPATGKSLTDVADASPADALRALDEAVAVSSKWASTPARERGEILRAVFEKITERAEDVALLMTLEMGKALAESRAEVKYGAEFFRWFSEEAVRIGGRYTPAPAGNGRILVTKRRSDRVWPSLPGISRWRWYPQDRPGVGRRLHDHRQARLGDPVDDVVACSAHGRSRVARRSPLGVADIEIR